MGFRHAGPTRHDHAVPCAQAAFEAGGFSAFQPHLLIMLSFDFASGQGHNPGFTGLAVQPESGQFGIIGVRGNHHHPLIAVVGLAEHPKLGLPRDAAKTPANTQLSTDQGRTPVAQIQIAQAIDPSFEGLPIRRLAARQLHVRVKKTAQPATFDLDRQDEGFIASQAQRLIRHQLCALKTHCRALAVWRKAVLVIVFGRVEEMVGKPGLMGHPAQHRQQQRQPPDQQHTAGNQHQQANQQANALVAPVALEKLLFAADGLAHGFTLGFSLPAGAGLPAPTSRALPRLTP